MSNSNFVNNVYPCNVNYVKLRVSDDADREVLFSAYYHRKARCCIVTLNQIKITFGVCFVDGPAGNQDVIAIVNRLTAGYRNDLVFASGN